VAEPTDSELVLGLRAADGAAFDALYARYRPALFSFLVRLTGRRWLAEDLLQETWLRLARNAVELPPDTALRPWLFTVARNVFVSYRRWAVLDADRLRELGLWPGQRSETPFELAAATETERALEAGLAALPVTQREVLLLCAVERMEPSEAAKVLGLEPEAVRKRLSRARGMLAEHLARQERTRS